MLRKFSDSEQAGLQATIKDPAGRPMRVEALAEMYIGDCSDFIAKGTAVSAALTDAYTRNLWVSLVAGWQQNLHYMEWWLQNRRATRAPN